MKKAILAAILCSVFTCAWGLEILEATYGAGDQKVDFKEAFEKFKRNDNFYYGKLDANRMAGADPAKGKSKKVTIRYRETADGAEKTISFGEKDSAFLCPGLSATGEFTLIAAWYGAETSFVDVSEAVKKAIADDEAVKVGNATMTAGTDPAKGKRKNLVIIYAKDGKLKSIQVGEGSKFEPAKITGAAKSAE